MTSVASCASTPALNPLEEPTPAPTPSRPRPALVREALAIEAEPAHSAQALGFMPRFLVQTTLPHSRPDSHSVLRRNGQLQVSLSAHPLVGLPYGRYPRLLLAWITTQAVRTRQRHLELGPSISSFMTELGLQPRGGQSGTLLPPPRADAASLLGDDHLHSPFPRPGDSARRSLPRCRRIPSLVEPEVPRAGCPLGDVGDSELGFLPRDH